MYFLTPRNVLIVLLAMVIAGILVYLAYQVTGLRSSTPDYDDEEFEDDEDDEEFEDDEDEDDEDEDEDNFALSLFVPVEIGQSFSAEHMALRLTHPHCFADDWYDQSRRHLSLWVVEQAQIQAEWRKGMLSNAT